MVQNRSPAVMAQRAEPHESLDDFPTPPWATRAFVRRISDRDRCSVWEPAANRGYMVKVLMEEFDQVFASDVHDYGVGFAIHDFLLPGPALFDPDWIITNPPFRLSLEFVQRALGIAKVGVAVLVRSTWSESQSRFDALFRETRPNVIYQHVHRVSMVKGRYDPDISTATGYSWFVWSVREPAEATIFDWIEERRQDLFRPTDVEPWGGHS